MSILEILDELSEQFNSKKGFFGKKPDYDRCAELVDELYKRLPEELRQADVISAKRKEILDNADTVAKNTIRTAEEKARQTVGESRLVKQAEEEREKIIENAYAQADALIERTKAHLDGMFRETEDFLVSNINMIKKNRSELRAFNINNGDKNS